MYTLKRAKEHAWKSIIMSMMLFVFLSCVEYISLEAFVGDDIFKIGFLYGVRNVMLIMAVNLILLSVIQRLRLVFFISIALILFLGIANFFVIQFRGYGLVYMDIYAIKTAANVAGEYHYHIGKDLLLGLTGGISGITLCAIIPKGKYALGKIKRIGLLITGLAVAIAFFVWINVSVFFFEGISNLTWDHSIGMGEYGYLLYMTANAGDAKVTAPEGYSPEKADKILSRYQNPQQRNSVLRGFSGSEKNPNLIMIMNESFSDLEVLGNVKTDQEVLPFFHQLKKNTIHGYVYSSVYGGYTANSEFEFLSGCTKAFLPGSAYLQYIHDTFPTIIGNIKAQSGYDKAVAVHPYRSSGYNRNRIYPLLGFDEFQSEEDFKNPVKVRKYISDASDYKKLEEIFENKKQGSSLCLFNVTMQNHGSYDEGSYTFENPVKLTSQQLQFDVEQYLSLMKMSDEALRELIQYFEKVDEPVMIVLFGDHQPHLSDNFYYYLFGNIPENLSQEETMKKYKVPFVIWTNYDMPEKEIKETSINYLSTIMMDAAGMELTDYQKFLLDMYQYIPSISANGYYDYKGKFYTWTDTDCKYKKWIEEYKIVQYNYIFDEEHRKTAHFSLTDSK